MFIDCLLDALWDTLKLLPFLYLTYLLMEFLERHASEKTEQVIARSGKAGPFFGAVLGALPQCGFSAAGAGLYAGRVITTGTLLAVFWSTSDEMIPILISRGSDPGLILKILGIKVAVAALAGFLTDALCRLFRRPSSQHLHIEELCREEHCHCEGHSIWLSALIHTASISLSIFLISLGLNLVLAAAGENFLAGILSSRPIIGCMIAGLVGLIPNCAASVAITELYLSGILTPGAMLAGLLTGAGVGLLVLFRSNRPLRDSFRLTAILLSVALLVGILFDALSLGAWLGL